MKSMMPHRALREMMECVHTSQRKLSKLLGKSESYIGTTLSKQSDVATMNFVAMANVMGFRVIIEGHGMRFEVAPTTGHELRG